MLKRPACYDMKCKFRLSVIISTDSVAYLLRMDSNHKNVIFINPDLNMDNSFLYNCKQKHLFPLLMLIVRFNHFSKRFNRLETRIIKIVMKIIWQWQKSLLYILYELHIVTGISEKLGFTEPSLSASFGLCLLASRGKHLWQAISSRFAQELLIAVWIFLQTECEFFLSWGGGSCFRYFQQMIVEECCSFMKVSFKMGSDDEVEE